MKKVLGIVLVVCTVCGFASLAGATSFEFGGKLGYVLPTGDFADVADEGFAGGMYIGYYITNESFIELAFLTHQHDIGIDEEGFKENIDDLAADLGIVSDIDLRFYEFTVGGTYLFGKGRFTPFVKGGVGAYVWDTEVKGRRTVVSSDTTTSTESSPTGTTTTTQTTTSSTLGVEESRSDTNTDFGINGGGGLRFMLTGEITLAAEATYNYVFGGIDDGYVNLLGTLSYNF